MQLIINTPLGVVKGKKQDYSEEGYSLMQWAVEAAIDDRGKGSFAMETEEGRVFLGQDVVRNSVFHLTK